LKKFTDEELRQLLNQGLSPADAARKLEVTRSCISRRMKGFKSKSTLNIVSANSFREADRRLQVMTQLLSINKDARRMLKDLGEKDPTRIKVWAEIRRQLDFQLKIFEVLYSVETARRFQQTVMEVIEEISPDVREEIISKLNERAVVRRLLDPDQ